MRHSLGFAQMTTAAVALALAGVAVGLAFGGWLDRGTQMFLAMAEAGLAWCL